MTRRYPNPPVVEALCEIFFRGSQWDAAVPGLFYQRVQDRFPKRGEQHSLALELKVGPGVSPHAKVIPEEPRARFLREDGSRIVQVGRDLVVVNQLRPYPEFADWRPEILSALETYRALARPTQVPTIGLRYINRIEIPAEVVHMERYFRLYPEVPERLGEGHGAFMLRVELEAPSPHGFVATLGSAPPEGAGRTAIMLDLYDTVNLPNPASFDSVPALIDEAHANVERVFENVITDEARALFGG